ncbi:hypothetical protein M0G74_11440 [Microbulbifer sp. CAU 1566]|uniref:PKD domain-containing protein n=1 Tax=Microbulbifer sp. CAU 1566 TaxID=2933269 RepID=UPI002006A49F|nr:hypothetical protein [Microbulbifer sp. CAU 1566]MCK7597885.1 hypothetical protein [Microbulbifer sp. CAU 1566]
MRIKGNQSAGLAAVLSSLLLAACGGGSGGNGGGNGDGNSSEPTNKAPSVNVAAVSIAEGGTVNVAANASDSDGTIATYHWEQTSGVTLELGNTDGESLTINAPAVTSDAEAVVTVTVTDNKGAQSSATFNVTIVANVTTIEVAGLVADQSAANAEILFAVGSETFTTQADTEGNYTLSVSVDDSELAGVIRAEASSGDPGFKLVSLLAADALLGAAGDDGVVTRDEFLPLNISSVTTALAAQIEGGVPGSVTSAEQLRARQKQLNGNEVFQLAVLISLVLDADSSAVVSVPEGVSDTYALASDMDRAARFATQIQSSDAALYQAAVNAIAADSSLAAVRPPSSVSLEDTYYLTSGNVTPIPFDRRPSEHFGRRLTLAPGAQGELSGLLGSGAISWSLQPEGLVISGIEFQVREDYRYDEALGQQVLEQVMVRPRLVQWLSSDAQVDWLLITLDQYTRYPDGEYPPTEPVSFTDATMAIRAAGTVSAQQLLEMGIAISVPLPGIPGEVTDPVDGAQEPSIELQAVQLVFAGSVETGGSVTVNKDIISGRGIASSSHLSTSWAIDASGHVTIADLLGYPAELVFLESGNPKAPKMYLELTDGAERLSTVATAYRKEAPAWTAERAVGIYRYPQDFFSPLEPFWFEVNADGTALTVSAWDANGDGELATSELTQMPGYWQINSAGNLVIRRYFSQNSGFCEADSWDPAPSDSCVLYHEREWVLHQEAANESVALRNNHRFFADPFHDPEGEIPDEHILSSALSLDVFYQKVPERPAPLMAP